MAREGISRRDFLRGYFRKGHAALSGISAEPDSSEEIYRGISRRGFVKGAAGSGIIYAALGFPGFSEEAQAITTTQEALKDAEINISVRQFEQMIKQNKFPLLPKNRGLNVILQPGDSGYDLVEIVYKSAKGQFGISYPVEVIAKGKMFNALEQYNGMKGIKLPKEKVAKNTTVRVFCRDQYIQKIIEDAYKEIDGLKGEFGKYRKEFEDYKAYTEGRFGKIEERLGKAEKGPSEYDLGQDRKIEELRRKNGELGAELERLKKQAFQPPAAPAAKKCDPKKIGFYNVPNGLKDIDNAFEDFITRPDLDIYLLTDRQNTIFGQPEKRGLYFHKRGTPYILTEDKDILHNHGVRRITPGQAKAKFKEMRGRINMVFKDVQAVAASETDLFGFVLTEKADGDYGLTNLNDKCEYGIWSKKGPEVISGDGNGGPPGTPGSPGGTGGGGSGPGSR